MKAFLCSPVPMRAQACGSSMMKTLKNLAIVAAMVIVGSLLAVAQGGPPKGGQQVVAGARLEDR